MSKLKWNKPHQIYTNNATKTVSILEAYDPNGQREPMADITIVMESCPCCDDIHSVHIIVANSCRTWQPQNVDEQKVSAEIIKNLVAAEQASYQKAYDEIQ